MSEIPLKTNPEILTVADVALRLKVSESQVYALIEKGLLRCYRVTTGKQGGIRIHETDHLAIFLKSVESGGDPYEQATPKQKQESAGGFNVLDADRLREAWKNR